MSVSTDAPGDRGIANRFFLELTASVRSIPVRPLSQIAKPRILAPCAQDGRNATVRQVAALAASAIANRVMIYPSAVIPRRLSIDDAPMIIEYGACMDIFRSGLADYTPGCGPTHEALQLTESGYQAMTNLLEKPTLVSSGILMPD